MRSFRIVLIGLFIPALISCGSVNYTPDGEDSALMLRGYDPVAYYVSGQPVAGRADLKADYLGYYYRFASDEHLRQFITAPEKYAPQFGGFCAQSMAYAIPVAADGRHFKIIDGKLYLFDGARARLYFEMDQERNLRLANHYWESEVRNSTSWRYQSLKRLVFRVPNYKSNADLAEEYQRRFGRAPG
jgi:YHS domain-containing protein